MIVEPVAGSTGVLVPPKGYLQRLRQICDKHGILLIFDEVITGFRPPGHGRLRPSISGSSRISSPAPKGLTNGTIPMGAVICRKGIYESLHGLYRCGGRHD